jgi:hypothetical protein
MEWLVKSRELPSFAQVRGDRNSGTLTSFLSRLSLRLIRPLAERERRFETEAGMPRKFRY